MEYIIQSGDIAKVEADALITAINSGGLWFGGIDRVIQGVAGNLFHNQAKKANPLTDGKAIIAMRGNTAHRGAFTNVVFVVDDLQQPLRNIIYAGLRAASNSGFKTVTLPAIRMGVMLGVVEHSKQEAVDEMIAGIKKFQQERSDGLKRITLVVYGDTETEKLLSDAAIAELMDK